MYTAASPQSETNGEHNSSGNRVQKITTRTSSRVTFSLPSRSSTLSTNRSCPMSPVGKTSPYESDRDLIDSVFGHANPKASHHDSGTKRLPLRSACDLPSFPLLPRICSDTPTDTEASVMRLAQYMRDFDRIFPGCSPSAGAGVFDTARRSSSSSCGNTRRTRGEHCNRSKCSPSSIGVGRSKSQAAKRHRANSQLHPSPSRTKQTRAGGASTTRRNGGSRLFRNSSEPMLHRKRASAVSRAQPPPPLNQNSGHFARSRSTAGDIGAAKGRKMALRNGGVSRQQQDLKTRPQWQSSSLTGKPAGRRKCRQSVHEQFRELAKYHYRHIASSPSLRELASRSIEDELTATYDSSKSTESTSPSKSKRHSLLSNAKSTFPLRSTPNSGSTSRTSIHTSTTSRTMHASRARSQKSLLAQAYGRSRPNNSR